MPLSAPGAWCAATLSLRAPGPWWAKLTLEDRARGQIVRDVFLGKLRRRGGIWSRATLLHVPAEARHVAVHIFGTAETTGAALSLRPLSRADAALRLAWSGARAIPRALAGSPLGAPGRVRAVIGQAPARAGEAPSYAEWIALYEHPPDAAALQSALAWNAEAVILPAGAGVASSLATASRQLSGAPAARVITTQAAWSRLAAEWIILLDAGEILAPHARAAFAAAAACAPWADILTADCDVLSASGERRDPLFKPGPDALLSTNALYANGAMAVRRAALPAALPASAGAARLHLLRTDAGRIAHVPGVLSHVRVLRRASAAPPAPAPEPGVTIIIPSAARGGHVARCLGQVARHTAYGPLAIRLVLAAPARARARVLSQAARLPRVTVHPTPCAPFNYARVNNLAARDVTSKLLLLMNDDVAPINRDWLARMAAHMQDPRVGIVGARLFYGNGMVQHEGVITGLANLCEHAGRLREGGDSGPHGIAMLDREVSAVTAACLLIRTCLYRELGGMDEVFAIALNDVDLCLRAREAGWRVIYCAGARLHHYESLSLGRHYAGMRAGLESVEVRRLRARHADAIADDPFYNPLASLQPGREWQPAFPPRPHAPARGGSKP